MATRTTSIDAPSKSADSPSTVNSTVRPSGSHWGQRCVFSPFASSSLVSGSAVPPAAGIRRSPEKTAGANTMVPSFPHDAPRLRSTGARVIGAPPVTEIFLSSRGVTKPSHSPSGEKNGL